VPKDVREALAVPVSDLIDALHGIAHLMHSLAALLLMCDGRDLGAVIGDKAREWFAAPGFRGSAASAVRTGGPPGPPPPTDVETFEASVFLYDHYSGGIGLAEALHPRFVELLQGARGRLAACACTSGCPACVGPDREVGLRAKPTARCLLDLLLARSEPAFKDHEAEAPVGTEPVGIEP
jgi:DEAD/DEAH box helicase domain-containing protein